MALGHKAILLPIISSFNAKGVKQAQGALSGLGNTIKGAAGAFVAFQAISSTIDFAGAAITQARDLERNLLGLKTVFKDASGEMKKFAESGQNFGLSTSDAAQASTFLGTVLKSAGFDMRTTQDETKKLTTLASDLAVTYGYDVQEALTGMTALFRGEYDPIEKFGVAMKQSEINAVLAANGQDKLSGAARRNAEQQIRLQLLYERTQDAQGAFARSSGSLFTEQMKLTAAFENMQASVGGALTPVLAKLMTTLTPLVDKIAPSLAGLFELLGMAIENLTPLFEPLIDIFGIVIDTVAGVSQAFQPLSQQIFGTLGELLTNFVVPALTGLSQALIALSPLLTLIGGAIGLLIHLLTGFGRILGTMLEPLGRLFGGFFNDFVRPLLEGLTTFLGLIPRVSSSMTGLATTTINPMTGKPWDARRKTRIRKPKPDPILDDGETEAEKRARKERERIAAQKKAYADLAKSIQDSFASIRESILSAFDITQMGQSSQGVLSNVKRLLAQTKKFAESIRALAGQGLNTGLLNQLISAGPMGAGRLAASLASSGAVSELNAAYSEFGAIASDIANIGTTAQFANPTQSQYQIYVNAGVGDKNTIGKAIVEAIKTYESQSGPGWRA